MYTLVLIFICYGGWDSKAVSSQNITGFQTEQLCEQAKSKVGATDMTILRYCLKIK